VANIVKFTRNVLGRELEVVVDQTFPQQFKPIDCGYFMLCGLKDCVENKSWSFDAEDMSARKAEIARVLIGLRSK
jgi:Ulp1 family protease